MFDIELPFPCEPIPSGHCFGALIRAGAVAEDARIDRVTLSTEGVASARLAQLWMTEDGRAQSRSHVHYAPGVRPPAPRPLLNPSISLAAMLLDGRQVIWYWLGDGTYDGWSSGNPQRQPLTSPAGDA